MIKPEYLAELLSDGWTEAMIAKLPLYTFDIYEARQLIAPCSIVEFLAKGKEALAE